MEKLVKITLKNQKEILFAYDEKRFNTLVENCLEILKKAKSKVADGNVKLKEIVLNSYATINFTGTYRFTYKEKEGKYTNTVFTTVLPYETIIDIVGLNNYGDTAMLDITNLTNEEELKLSKEIIKELGEACRQAL